MDKTFNDFRMKLKNVLPEGDTSEPKAYLYFEGDVGDQDYLDLGFDKFDGIGIDRDEVVALTAEILGLSGSFSFGFKPAVEEGQGELVTQSYIMEAVAEKMVSARLKKKVLNLSLLVPLKNSKQLYELRNLAGKDYLVSLGSAPIVSGQTKIKE